MILWVGNNNNVPNASHSQPGLLQGQTVKMTPIVSFCVRKLFNFMGSFIKYFSF